MRKTVAAATVGIMAVAAVPTTFEKPEKPDPTPAAQTLDLGLTSPASVEALEDQAEAVREQERQAREYEAAMKASKEAHRKAVEARKEAERSRSAKRTPKAPQKTVQPPSQSSYGNNLDGWIREALSIMAKHGIPGSYNGLYRNIMRESGGNPHAINLTDSNAAKGTPSKGLLQAIDPTFRAYHVGGTSWDIYDPVANIVACANYAAHTYGSIDNVNGAY